MQKKVQFLIVVLIIITLNTSLCFGDDKNDAPEPEGQWWDLSYFNEFLEYDFEVTYKEEVGSKFINDISDPDNTLYIVVGIDEPFNKLEAEALYSFVESGGKLLVAGDVAGNINPLAEKFDIEYSEHVILDRMFDYNYTFIPVDVDSGETSFIILAHSPLGLDPQRHLFNIEPHYRQELKEGTVSDLLRIVFEDNDVLLNSNAKITKENDQQWKIMDGASTYIIEDTDTQLNIYFENVNVNILARSSEEPDKVMSVLDENDNNKIDAEDKPGPIPFILEVPVNDGKVIFFSDAGLFTDNLWVLKSLSDKPEYANRTYQNVEYIVNLVHDMYPTDGELIFDISKQTAGFSNFHPYPEEEDEE